MFKNSSLFQFFASVKLALLILGLISVTSIIGTVIPQKESAEFYIQKYGTEMAQLMEVLDIPDMYSSWWFVALLVLLTVNLIVCSIERLPLIWRQVVADGLSYPVERVRKMSNRHQWRVDDSAANITGTLERALREKGWKSSRSQADEGTLLFSQKGNWTRLGVYVVHISILVIFLGGIIGAVAGFKGFVMIPETTAQDSINLFDGGGTRQLGFSVRCNSFGIDFYENGAPKEYTSSLTILENGQEVLTKEIEVNAPLTYKGITFYQSSYEPFREFIIALENLDTGARETFVVPFQQQKSWEEAGLTFGVINARALGQSIVSSKLWISDGLASPLQIWVDQGTSTPVPLGSGYQVNVKQMYATGLQVAKDPGVWWVYIGFTMMLFGLYVAFFMSHQRLWVVISERKNGAEVVLAGTANKNRPGFEDKLQDLGRVLEAHTRGFAAEHHAEVSQGLINTNAEQEKMHG